MDSSWYEEAALNSTLPFWLLLENLGGPIFCGETDGMLTDDTSCDDVMDEMEMEQGTSVTRVSGLPARIRDIFQKHIILW